MARQTAARARSPSTSFFAKGGSQQLGLRVHHIKRDGRGCAAQGAPTGRLLRYDPRDGSTRVVAEDIWFANGVALSPDGTWAAVVETNSFRVHRVWLSGPQVGPRLRGGVQHGTRPFVRVRAPRPAMLPCGIRRATWVCAFADPGGRTVRGTEEVEWIP